MHRGDRTTANSIATINSVASGELHSISTNTSSDGGGDVYNDGNGGNGGGGAGNNQVCDLRYFI